MDITYTYMKKRRDFGRQAMFCVTSSVLIDSIPANAVEQKVYILRNPVNTDSQASATQSERYVNTTTVVCKEDGINHVEGGWPKDINWQDDDATLRYRRRAERDDDYIETILHTIPKLTHYINQNNAIEIYQMYFENFPPEPEVEKSSIVVKNVYKSPRRPVSSIAWTTECDPKLVVSQCDRRFPKVGYRPKTNDEDMSCKVWDLEKSNDPFIELYSPADCWKVACSPFNRNIVVTGIADGRVCVFDFRKKYRPVAISPFYLAHRDPVNSLIYIHSRLNTEFFSASTDGLCMWWDFRNLSAPTDTLTLSVKKPFGEESKCHTVPVSVLQYDRSLPTRFLCGTDTGLVLNVNRKGKTPEEIISSVVYTHTGPVKAVHRSPLTSKIFITCGDWTVKIWSDDILTSSIIPGKPHRYPINDVAWTPLRVSCYMCISDDGKLRMWDLLRKYREPVITAKISNHPLLKLAPHEDGRFVATGDQIGSVYLLKLSENLIFSGDKDKQLMSGIYERETRRERILESRVKEIRLKLKADEAAASEATEVVDEQTLIKAAEEAYKKVVLEELNTLGLQAKVLSQFQMRKR